MKGTIAHLHHHYQLLTESSTARQAASRLDRLAATRLAPALATCLGQALTSDDCVYIMRRLHTQVGLRVDHDVQDNQLAERWAMQLAGGIMRTLAKSPDTLVVFDNQASFVATFVEDLLHGRSAQTWYYFPFNSWQGQPMAQTLQAVLLENAAHLPAILAMLTQKGLLTAVLQRLGVAGIRAVWVQGLAAAELADPAAVRPLYDQVMHLLVASGFLLGDTEALFHHFMSGFRQPVDWQSQHSLTTAVIAILHFLQRNDYLSDGTPTAWHSLQQRVSEVDWLDATAVGRAVTALPIGEPDDFEPTIQWQPTPRQQQLVADLLTAVSQTSLTLTPPLPSAENGLRLFATLMSHAPHWAGDTAVVRLIQEFLTIGDWWQQAGTTACLEQAVLQGNWPQVAAAFPANRRQQAVRALQFLHPFGTPGTDLVSKLAQASARKRHRATAVPGQEPGRLATSQAGLFLLLRAMLDGRLPSLIAQTAESQNSDPAATLTPLQTMIILLGLQWAGAAGFVADLIEPGIVHLAGVETAVGRTQLLAACQAHNFAWPQMEENLLRLLVGQRLLTGEDDMMQLQTVPDQSGQIGLPAADQTAALFSLALLRLWARWLRHFGTASAPYLLHHFVQRPGYLSLTEQQVIVEIEAGSMDVVLQMAGYLDPIERVSWLNGRSVLFRLVD